MSQLRVVKLTNRATLPKRATPFSAGLDLYSAYDYTVPPGQRVLVLTDLKVEIPEDCYGRIAPRSGLAVHRYIDIAAGVIDSDYRGNLCVVVVNNYTSDFYIQKGDRIAQLICERIRLPTVVEVKAINNSDRYTNGFGSSGR